MFSIFTHVMNPLVTQKVSLGYPCGNEAVNLRSTYRMLLPWVGQKRSLEYISTVDNFGTVLLLTSRAVLQKAYLQGG